jgi:hypothetical protein
VDDITRAADMTLDPRRDRTELRLKLYENGFTPLANKSKMCLVKGWSIIDVTPQLIQSKEWARSRSFSDTGIRCGDVVALDWDIDDPDLLNEMLDKVIELGLVEESPFVRIGRPPRELWVYRTSEKIGKRTTGHFVPAGAPEDHKGFAVEILGAGCQFAAFGQRDETTAYQWPNDSLLDHEYMDLPPITHKQVDVLRDFCEVFFAAHGLERRSPAGGTDHGYTIAYDLTPEMVFPVHDMGEMTVAELEEVLRANPDDVLRCSVETLRPTSGSWAGMASLSGGRLCISDHGTYTSHFPVEADLTVSMERLGALLAERFPEQARPIAALADLIDTTSEMDPRHDFDSNLVIALKRYAYVTNTDQVADVTKPQTPMRPEHFRNLMRPYYFAEAGPRGGTTMNWMFDAWMQHPDRLCIASIGLRPDQAWPLFEEFGAYHLNTYKPLELPTHGDATPGFDLLRNLLPIEQERQFFTQWLSYKLQHPDVRGPGIIMVANDTYGTGRGSLLSLIRAMFQPGLVRNIDFKTLAGQTYQSQYNSWLSDSLIVAVDEAQETSHGATKWQMRNNAYEHLKSIIDPANHDLEIIRKGVSNGAGKTHASILVFTNHADSVVLPEGDRRLGILENGPAMPQEYWDGFHRWRSQPENIGAFMAALRRVDLSNYNPYVAPPMTRAKADMIDAGVSDIDRATAMVLKTIVSPLMTKEQFILQLEMVMVENGFEFPDEWQRAAERIFLKKTRRLIGKDRITIEGKPRVVRMLGACDLDVLQDDGKLIETVLKNGPLSRPIKSSGQVVAFRSR